MKQSLAAAAQESNTATHRCISLRVLSKSLILSMLRNCGQFLTYSERKKPHVVWLFPLQSVLIQAAALCLEFSSNNNGGKASGEDFSTQRVAKSFPSRTSYEYLRWKAVFAPIIVVAIHNSAENSLQNTK